jgi:hypothetical protein
LGEAFLKFCQLGEAFLNVEQADHSDSPLPQLLELAWPAAIALHLDGRGCVMASLRSIPAPGADFPPAPAPPVAYVRVNKCRRDWHTDDGGDDDLVITARRRADHVAG